jgi:hypothetical protein
MNELETAKAIASGAIPSGQPIGNSSLVALRISGTGAAARPALGEWCWRPPQVWLSAETLARVAGLPVVIDHPRRELDATQYAARSIGAILYPYVADRSGVENTEGPDLWGIARVFLDPDQIAALPDLSTSPMVTFDGTEGNQTITLPDGRRCLVEAAPQTIDHVAIVTDGAGVWDKNLQNSGIRSDSKGKNSMAGENEDGNIDLLLTRFGDTLDKKLDPIVKRLDALETPKPAPTMSDAQKRRDAERAEWMKADAAACQRDDAEEGAEMARMVAAGEPEEVAADKARGARKDRMKRRDSQDLTIGRRSASDAVAERRESEERAQAQARADSAAQAFGESAPPPMTAERAFDYRKRLLRPFQKHSATFKEVDLYTVSDAATLAGIESVIYADAVKASKSPEVLNGFMRQIKRTNDSGHQITEWFGPDTIFKRFSAPIMAVTQFNVPARTGR